jgi:SAM-dependent methyltransferase
MGTALVQGNLWDERARDYAAILAHFVCPLYEAVFAAASVGPETKLLDVGCGPGLAAQLAARRGAHVAGLDVAEASLSIARERTPEGEFRAGEMVDLPWLDNTFDVVIGFNTFQYAADVMNALREARRVARPGGRVAMAVWGRAEDCDIVVIAAGLSKFLPPPERRAPSRSPRRDASRRCWRRPTSRRWRAARWIAPSNFTTWRQQSVGSCREAYRRPPSGRLAPRRCSERSPRSFGHFARARVGTACATHSAT